MINSFLESESDSLTLKNILFVVQNNNLQTRYTINITKTMKFIIIICNVTTTIIKFVKQHLINDIFHEKKPRRNNLKLKNYLKTKIFTFILK